MNPILWELGDGIVVRTLTPDDDVEDCCGAGVTPVRFRALGSGKATRKR